MTDAQSVRLTAGGSRVRRNRGQGVQRNTSARSSAYYNDDYLQPQPQSQGHGYAYGSLGLRSTASRYSLNDQFAATRQDFEFDFDDGASTFDRSTVASMVIDEQWEDADDTAVPGPIADYYDPSALQGIERLVDPYDLLVLPPNPSPQDIRRAYFRLFVLLYPDTHPPKLRKAASVYFTLVQTAFEQLIGPEKGFLRDLEEANTYDLALDDPGRYQVYQLWHVSLAKLKSRPNEHVTGHSNSGPDRRKSESGYWHTISGCVDRAGLSLDRWQDWTKHGSLGLGIKLDMGSPYQFETAARGFSRFSVLNRQLLSLVPIQVAPRIELNYKLPNIPQDRGSRGSWTVSTAVEPRCLGASLRYDIDVADLKWPPSESVVSESTTPQPARKSRRGLRIETELSSGWLWSRFLALRCLKRVGRFSKCGFELGINNHYMHLSLYWSRLGQRIRLPFLVNLAPSLSPRTLLWTTLVPFAGFVAWEYISYRRSCQAAKLQKQDQFGVVQERRAEADDLTILLSTNVEKKRDSERASRGLVILSAKYGVKKDESWGLEEVADVTYAVAALVDNSQLYIPSNVNKNNILGFWDPVPGTPKTLHVRYLYQGKEGTVEVAQQTELLLPVGRVI